MHVILIYLGIFIGVFLEGELVMLTSIIASRSGNLNLWIVILVGVLSTIFSDMFYFFIGRNRGKAWLLKNRRFIPKAKHVNRKIEKYPVLIFVIYRFLYGLRMITPLLIGLSKTKTRKFFIYCIFSTLLWAAVYSVPGYFFGELIKSKVEHLEKLEHYIFLVIAILASAYLVRKKLMQKELVSNTSAKSLKSH